MAVSRRGASWQARVEYRDAAGRIHKLTGTAPTKSEARVIESELLRKRDMMRRGGDGTADSAHVPTFADMLAAYADWRGCGERVREKQMAHIQYRLQDIAGMHMDQITRATLSDLQRSIAGSDYSSAVRNETIQLVRAVCRYYAAVYGAPDPSVLMHAVPQTPDEVLRVSEHPVLTPDQFARVVPYAPSPYREFFIILFWTGMRRGELIALYRDDVDVSGQRLHVAHSQRNATQIRGTTKTRAVRWIGIDDTTWQVVLQVCHSSAGPYLFGGDRPLSPTTLDRQWHAALSAATADDPLLPQITIHGLRHSHATWLINSGVNIVAVSRRLGHASVEQTLRTYTHLLDNTGAQCVQYITDYRGAHNSDS